MRHTLSRWCLGGFLGAVIVLTPGWVARGDTLTLTDGTVIQNCFVRDEAIRYLVWEKMEDVGTPKMRVIPKSQIKAWTLERDASWDEHATVPDLTITFIEMNPKLVGVHWHVNYDDKYGRPILRGGAIVDQGDNDTAAMHPEEAAKNLKLKYTPGEEVTLTAHVKNVGFANSQAFEYVWLIDGKEVGKGRYAKELKELEETTFTYKYKWEEGKHTAEFKITTVQPEIATINNELTIPLWGWGFTFVINRGRTLHGGRNTCGSFCFEDYYQWHVGLMNTLFAASVYPSSPDGIIARVRLDRIIYLDDPADSMKACTAPDGMGYLQGMWTWNDIGDEKEKNWPVAPLPQRCSTEWSLPHELGHQLGLTDGYCLDYAGDPDHLWPDGKPVTHLNPHPITMMTWHGPHVYSETDAGYFNYTWDKPRGHFGDYYFAIPLNCYLQILDINGQPIPGAKVEVFQRATEVDPNGQGGEDQGVQYAAVIENGDFSGQNLSKEPVIVGQTDETGVMRLPNRPVKEVITLNGFHRRPNPFGNINVGGSRGLMVARVTKDDKVSYFWLSIYDFNVAWFRGQKDKFVRVLRTPNRALSSPVAPRNVRVTPQEDGTYKVTWDEPEAKHEMVYLERVLGYHVYRRIGTMGLNDRPWFPVTTTEPGTREVIIDPKQFPQDTGYYSNLQSFGVTTVGETGVESEMTQVELPE